MGRTQMQDAVPIRLGQEFKAYSAAIRRDINRMEIAQEEMKTLNMGGTAIGTGINADENTCAGSYQILPRSQGWIWYRHTI